MNTMFKNSQGDFISIDEYKTAIKDQRGSLIAVSFSWQIDGIKENEQRLFEDYYIDDFLLDLFKILNEEVNIIRFYDIDDCFHFKIKRDKDQQFIIEIQIDKHGEITKYIVNIDIDDVKSIRKKFQTIAEAIR